MSDAEHKAELLRRFKTELAGCNFDRAAVVQKENQLGIGDVMSTVNTLFTELIDEKKYTQALQIGQYYRLDGSKLDELINLEFGRLFALKEYEQAIKWANEYNLSESEVAKAASKYFHVLLEKDNVEEALTIPEKYRIKKEAFQNIAQQYFNEAYQKRQFYHAAMIGGRFDVSPKRVLLAARSAFLQAITKGDLKTALKTQQEFDLFSDAAFEEIRTQDRTELTSALFQHGIAALSDSKRHKRLEDFVQGMGLFEQKFKTTELREVVGKTLLELVKLHNEFLDQGQLDKAVQWFAKFGLLDDFVPTEIRHQVIKAADNYHNACLERLDYDKAKSVRVTYGLFKNNITPDSQQTILKAVLSYFAKALENAQIDKAKCVIDDYEVPVEKYGGVVKEGLLYHLRRRNFDPTFALVKNFKVNLNDEQIMREVKLQFDDSIKNQLVEIATEIGNHFKLDKDAVGPAAFQAWERHLKYGRYDKAYAIYRQYKFPYKSVAKIAREVYDYNLRNGNDKVAEKIRRQYSLNVSVMEAILQWFRKIGILH